jgi:single-strand DNA-binding protein
MSLNKVTLIGNLGQDPEIRSTGDGREIASFSVATTESWKDKNTGEKRDKTEWHRIVVFSQGLVGIIKNYVKKGSKLYIEGSLQTRKWTDKDGVDKYTTEIVLQNFNSNLQMLGSKGVNKEQDQNKSIEETARDQFEGSKVVELDDSIPF